MAIAKRLENFDIHKIIYNNRNKNEIAAELGYEYVDMDTLLQESDFLICSCAATKETEHIFNFDKFQKMKRDSIFINISRGSVVNQDDLVIALKQGLIGAAGLDVTTPEPLPVDHELFKLNNCIITPHIGSGELQTRIKMARTSVQNIINALNNQELIYEIKFQDI
jgi:glyoxylate/hydroxypyruvate reductase